MFEITDAEKLRDAYTLLAFIRDDVPTQPPPNRSPAWPPLWSASRKISGPTTTARRLTATLSRSTALKLVRLPDELDKVNEDDAAEWFQANRYYEFRPTPYDCSGQRFTNWYKLHRRCGHWFAYHSVSFDV